ncbi:MAG: GntR family transcriptional regulator, partial [Lentisphaeria bacterium]
MAGELKPGTRLPQQKLARELGVNQGAVRESLFELRYAGLVEITDGLGAFVLNLDEERLIEALHIREALEGMAARICCETLNRRQLDELRELAAEVDHLGATGRIEEMCPRDEQFHSRIVELTEMPMLERLADSYRTLARIARMWPEGHILEPEHQNLLVPIQHNDPDEAERAMR